MFTPMIQLPWNTKFFIVIKKRRVVQTEEIKSKKITRIDKYSKIHIAWKMGFKTSKKKKIAVYLISSNKSFQDKQPAAG